MIPNQLRRFPVLIGVGHPTVKVMRVSPGLSVLRYISAEDGVMPPAVRVAPKTLGGGLEFIPAPGAEADLLRSPGTAIVLVTETEIDLAITVIPHPQSNSTAVELHLELLSSSASSNVRDEHGQKRDVASLLSGQISLLGHVARRGDVLVQTGEWLGGPEFPARIEGLEIRWPRMPPGFELEYSVIVGGKTPRKLPTCRVNEFAGTKGRASPIVGLTIALRGEHANSHEREATPVRANPVSRAAQGPWAR